MKIVPIKISFNLICFMVFIFTLSFMPSFFNGYSTSLDISIAEFYDNDNFTNILNRRMTDPVFTKRPVVYSIVQFTSKITSLPFQFIYNIINLIAIVLIAFLLKSIGVFYKIKVKNAIGFLFILFPILFCTCSMMAGFDDYFHWALSLGVFYLILQKKTIIAAILFLLSVITRESILLLMPLFFYVMEKKMAYYILFIAVAILGIFFISRIGVNNQASVDYFLNERFEQFDYNFGSFEKSLKSFWTIFISVIVPILLIKSSNSTLKYVMVLTGILTLIVTVFTIFMDEARASFYPFIFSVPFWEEKITYGLKNSKQWITDQLFIIPIFLLLASYFSFYLYIPCISKSCFIYQIYSCIAITISAIIFYANRDYLSQSFSIIRKKIY